MSDNRAVEGGSALAGKIALLTGASRGIGRAFGVSLAQQGAHVALVARSDSDLADVAESVRSFGRQAIPLKADVTREDDVARAVSQTVDQFGTIDVLFNGAGVGYIGAVDEMSVELWDRTFDVNVRGAFLFCRCVLPIMKNKKRGSIINVASSDRGYATKSAYLASKFAIVALTQALAEEVTPFNIAVNCVRFGVVVDTELARIVNPGADRAGWQKPEDVVDILSLLAQQDASGITAGYINTREWQRQIRGPLAYASTPVPDALKAK